VLKAALSSREHNEILTCSKLVPSKTAKDVAEANSAAGVLIAGSEQSSPKRISFEE
jgi:hypothetical protein